MAKNYRVSTQGLGDYFTNVKAKRRQNKGEEWLKEREELKEKLRELYFNQDPAESERIRQEIIGKVSTNDPELATELQSLKTAKDFSFKVAEGVKESQPTPFAQRRLRSGSGQVYSFDPGTISGATGLQDTYAGGKKVFDVPEQVEADSLLEYVQTIDQLATDAKNWENSHRSGILHRPPEQVQELSRRLGMTQTQFTEFVQAAPIGELLERVSPVLKTTETLTEKKAELTSPLRDEIVEAKIDEEVRISKGKWERYGKARLREELAIRKSFSGGGGRGKGKGEGADVSQYKTFKAVEQLNKAGNESLSRSTAITDELIDSGVFESESFQKLLGGRGVGNIKNAAAFTIQANGVAQETYGKDISQLNQQEAEGLYSAMWDYTMPGATADADETTAFRQLMQTLPVNAEAIGQDTLNAISAGTAAELDANVWYDEAYTEMQGIVGNVANVMLDPNSAPDEKLTFIREELEVNTVSPRNYERVRDGVVKLTVLSDKRNELVESYNESGEADKILIKSRIDQLDDEIEVGMSSITRDIIPGESDIIKTREDLRQTPLQQIADAPGEYEYNTKVSTTPLNAVMFTKSLKDADTREKENPTAWAKMMAERTARDESKFNAEDAAKLKVLDGEVRNVLSEFGEITGKPDPWKIANVMKVRYERAARDGEVDTARRLKPWVDKMYGVNGATMTDKEQEVVNTIIREISQ